MSDWVKQMWANLPLKYRMTWFLVKGVLLSASTTGTTFVSWLTNAPSELTNVTTKGWLEITVFLSVVYISTWVAYMSKSLGEEENK